MSIRLNISSVEFSSTKSRWAKCPSVICSATSSPIVPRGLHSPSGTRALREKMVASEMKR